MAEAPERGKHIARPCAGSCSTLSDMACFPPPRLGFPFISSHSPLSLLSTLAPDPFRQTQNNSVFARVPRPRGFVLVSRYFPMPYSATPRWNQQPPRLKGLYVLLISMRTPGWRPSTPAPAGSVPFYDMEPCASRHARKIKIGLCGAQALISRLARKSLRSDTCARPHLAGLLVLFGSVAR